MIEILKSVLVFGFVLYLILLLYVLPSYFRRLDKLFGHLKSKHSSIYSDLGKPSLSLLDMNIRRTIAMVMFLLRKRYLALNDDGAMEIGNAARRHSDFLLLI